MTTSTIEKPPAAPALQAVSAPSTPAARPPAPRASAPLLLGLDLGTNKSCVLAGAPGSTDITVSKVVPSVVGYVKDGIVDGIITGNAKVLFGEEAIRQMLHVDLVAPLAQGVIARPEAARDFMQHLRSLADPTGRADIRAVVGVPANAGEQARDAVRRAATGIFSRILLIPEPFLAALGFRDDSRIRQPGYVDPVVNSLFIDIGGGTSDVCLIQGYFPTREDQISIPFAGDAIDELIFGELNRTYPNNGLSRHSVREMKEAHSYVGPSRRPMEVKVVVGGKSRVLEIADAVGNPCNMLIDKIYPALTALISAASSDSVVALLQNIIVTGGGSQIRGIDTVLQKRLSDEGFESPRVRLAGQDFQRYVALGALKAARAARENQWQVLFD
jgi:rod shape-determining protein MreB